MVALEGGPVTQLCRKDTLGLTTGRGKADMTHTPNRSLKRIFGYPLVADYRERLARISS